MNNYLPVIGIEEEHESWDDGDTPARATSKG